MARNPILRTVVCGLVVCLAPALVQASEHHGIVRFAGLPVPGATVTATQGEKKVAAVTDPQGIYTFADLADGVWNLQVEMLCFTTLKMEVAVAPNAPRPECNTYSSFPSGCSSSAWRYSASASAGLPSWLNARARLRRASGYMGSIRTASASSWRASSFRFCCR